MKEEDIPNIPEGYGYNLRMGKLKRFIFLWRNGRQDHYPICCILRFSLENALADGKLVRTEKESAIQRGTIKRSEDCIFVPCNIFHRL